jgi:hypothetical protein
MGIVVPVDTPVSKETITSLSVKARMTWEELYLWGMALLTFCRMTKASNNAETDAEDNLPQESDKDNGNMVSQEIEETSIQPISPSTLILYLPF